MTDQHVEQIKQQIPEGETIVKMYKAFEGDYRVITQSPNGFENRYTVVWIPETNEVKIRLF